MFKLTTRLVIAATTLFAACASQPKGPSINIVMGKDGSVSVQSLGPDGKPSTDPESLAMAALLGQALAEQSKADAPAAPDVWKELDGGHVEHIPSGALCPAEWAGTKRGEVVTYIPDGSNVGCNYEAPRVGITFYVYRGDFAAAWAEADGAIKDRYPMHSSATFAGASDRFRSETYTVKLANNQEYRTSLLLADTNGWLLKLRITAPSGEAIQLEQRAGIGFIGQLDRLQFGAAPVAPKTNPA